MVKNWVSQTVSMQHSYWQEQQYIIKYDQQFKNGQKLSLTNYLHDCQ